MFEVKQMTATHPAPLFTPRKAPAYEWQHIEHDGWSRTLTLWVADVARGSDLELEVQLGEEPGELDSVRVLRVWRDGVAQPVSSRAEDVGPSHLWWWLHEDAGVLGALQACREEWLAEERVLGDCERGGWR